MESGGGLVKRRAPEPSPRSGDVPPPELRVGKCIEVWADDGRDWCSAWRRFQRARGAWCDERGLSIAEECRLLPDGAPWSVEFLIESGHRDFVEERMAQAGVTLSDIPELRAAAVTHSE
jgi:hypothetical protein